MASNRLAKSSLDALLKASPSGKTEKKTSTSNERKQRLVLPATKTGLKRIKHQIKYGHQKKLRVKASIAKTRQSPIGTVHRDEKKAEDNVERNVRYMTSVLKASETERTLRKQALEYRNRKM